MTEAPVVLLILDGWGQAPAGPGNAVSLAETPNIDAITSMPLFSLLACSGRAVGLPEGYMGNSEVGHMNIGAGRIVYQDMTRIDMAIENGSFQKNEKLLDLLSAVKASGGTLHVMGLLSDGGVHSHIDHARAILGLAHDAGVPSLVHAFMDGRDTAPDSGAGYMRHLLDFLPPSSAVASVSGRYYAMDRDKRWDRTEKAWKAIVHGEGERAGDALTALKRSYEASVTDEFVLPTAIGSYKGMKDGDAVLMFNFRADRMRALAHALTDGQFSGFDRGRLPALAALASMTRYESDIAMPVLFGRQSLENGLGEIVSKAGLSQLRIAETEKYAHVTYFFNGGREEPFSGEARCLVPSPRDVATYDLKPQMSAVEVTDKLLAAMEETSYDLVVCNLANMDMVGHTGIIPAAVTACETVDACVGRIHEAVRAKRGVLLLTADHGNAEEMLTPAHDPQTAHSKNPVALVVADYRQQPVARLLPEGKLGDIAPTVLSIMGIGIPDEMTGTALCEAL